jgi:hypothetical protein
MAAEDGVDGLLHLADVALAAGAQGLLDDRLLGAGPAPERALQRRVRTQPGVDLDEPFGAREDGDEGILQLLQRRVADRDDEAGDDGGVEPLLGLDARGDGEGDGQREGDDPDRQTGREVGEELPAGVALAEDGQEFRF